MPRPIARIPPKKNAITIHIISLGSRIPLPWEGVGVGFRGDIAGHPLPLFPAKSLISIIFFAFFICYFQIKCLLLQSLLSTRAFSSAGLEHLPYKQRVGGSNPSTPTWGVSLWSFGTAGIFFCPAPKPTLNNLSTAIIA